MFLLTPPCQHSCVFMLRNNFLVRWGVFTYSSLAYKCVFRNKVHFYLFLPYLEALDRCVSKYSKTRL